MKSPEDDRPVRNVTASEARTLLEEQQSSGLSIAAFARRSGVPPWALYNARAQARRRAGHSRSPRFAELAVIGNEAPTTEAREPAIELTLPSGLALRVGPDFDGVTLRRLLGVLATC